MIRVQRIAQGRAPLRRLPLFLRWTRTNCDPPAALEGEDKTARPLFGRVAGDPRSADCPGEGSAAVPPLAHPLDADELRPSSTRWRVKVKQHDVVTENTENSHSTGWTGCQTRDSSRLSC